MPCSLVSGVGDSLGQINEKELLRCVITLSPLLLCVHPLDSLGGKDSFLVL